MKISLITYGSRGDVQPVLALAIALRKAGHEVTVAGPPENEAWARDYGVRFQPFGSPFTSYADQFDNAHGISAAIHFAKFLLGQVELQFEQAPTIVAGADLVIGASLVFAVPSIAEYLNIAYRFIAFCPQILPSSHHPYPAVAFQKMPALLNRVTWHLKEWTDGALLRKPINHRRAKLGLPPLKSVWDNLLGNPAMVASDPALASIPADIGIDAFHSGYLHLDQHYAEDPVMSDYLSAGAPPVFIGFGSMPRKDSRRLLDMFRRATGSNNCRALIYLRDETQSRVIADDCCLTGNVVHDRLLPRCAAIVHHGGAGTTAASARAGIPQVIVPHMLDQFYWARQIELLGLGPRPVSRLLLNAGALNQAIKICLNDTAMQDRCRQAADKINPCDSLKKAINWVESAGCRSDIKNQCVPSQDMLPSPDSVHRDLS